MRESAKERGTRRWVFAFFFYQLLARGGGVQKKGEYSVGEVAGRARELLLCCVGVIKVRFITSSLRAVPVLVDELSPSDEYSKEWKGAGRERE